MANREKSHKKNLSTSYSKSRRKRCIIHGLMRLFTGFCVLLSCCFLLGIISFIAIRGFSALSVDFLTGVMAEVGASGGILYQLLGTLLLLLTAAVVVIPLALGCALVQSVFLTREAHRRNITLVLYLLNGVPSIVFGIIGMIVFVQWFGWGKSWLAGGILLGLMILPTVCVTLIERIQAIPKKYIEAARGLGLSRAQTVRSVILPQSIGGLFTGLLLGLARAAGETAPIMFTATIFSGATLPSGVKESPVLSLPYHIFILAQDSYDPATKAKLWGSALVLIFLVFLLSLLALPARLRIHEEANHL